MLMANIANDKQNRDSRLLSVRLNIPDTSSRFDDLPTSASVFIEWEWGSAQQKRCMQGYVTRDVALAALLQIQNIGDGLGRKERAVSVKIFILFDLKVACAEWVYDDEEYQQEQGVEGDQVITPLDASLSEPEAQTEYLATVLDVLKCLVVFPFWD